MIVVKEEHLSKIFIILVTFSVLNEDKSSVIKEEHPFDFSTSGFPPNIHAILVTFFVLNEDKLSEVKEEHSENIYCISVTF